MGGCGYAHSCDPLSLLFAAVAIRSSSSLSLDHPALVIIVAFAAASAEMQHFPSTPSRV